MTVATVTVTETIKETVAAITETATVTVVEKVYETVAQHNPAKEAVEYVGYSFKKLALYGIGLVVLGFAIYICYGLYLVFARLAEKADHKLKTNEKIKFSDGKVSLGLKKHSNEEKMEKAKKLASKVWAGYSYESDRKYATGTDAQSYDSSE